MRSSFVAPEAIRLHLSDGERWIEVKKELNFSDTKKVEMGAIRLSGELGNNDVAAEFDQDFEVNKLDLWIVDWNFEDGANKKVEKTLDAIRALDNDTAEEIDELIKKYREEKEKEKKASGASKPRRKKSA